MSLRTSGKRALRVAGMLGAAASLTVAGAGVASASWYNATVGGYTTGGVALRDCYHPSVQLPPSQSCTFISRKAPGTPTQVICQRSGQDIYGDNVWDYVRFDDGSEGFMADYYLNTGYSAWIPGVDVCQ